MYSDSTRCFIWPNSPAHRKYHRVTYPRDQEFYRAESARSGGPYQIEDDPILITELQDLDNEERSRLTTLLVDWRNQRGDDAVPEVTDELIERARRAPSLGVNERAERLLRFIGKQSKSIGDVVALSSNPESTADTDELAMAWSESTTLGEVRFLADYLTEQHWIRVVQDARYNVTVDGYRRLAELRTNPDIRQAFVAMWFDEEMDGVYERGVEPAIRNTGYKPLRIDQKADVIKIDDEIIAEIRRSRFLVADFTHGADGARGGVYFEAGFAFGLGIPIIYTCREDAIGKIHFDTRQYYHITWKEPNDLRENLEMRIRALIGDGPDLKSSNEFR